MHSQHVNKLQKELEYRDSQTAELRSELKTMSSKLNEQENMVFVRNSEVRYIICHVLLLFLNIFFFSK